MEFVLATEQTHLDRRRKPRLEGNFKVKYWDKEWQSIIYGNEKGYLKNILEAGFDGAYLDIIDAFHYFEDLQ